MKKNALDSQRLKALFPETPPAFTAFVERNLKDLEAGKETPVMKKKLSLGLVLALVLAIMMTAVAVAAILSPTAEIFGFLYGKEKQEALLKGDIATLGSVQAVGDLEVTLEDVVYQAEGEMQGLYGTGIIAPREGSKVVLIPEEYSPASPAGYTLHYGKDEKVPEDAPSYLELAHKDGAKLLQVRVRLLEMSIDGKKVETDVGSNHLAQPDGRVRFTFAASGPQIRRSENYELNLNLGWYELDQEGDPVGEIQKENWAVNVTPSLSETAKAEIAAQSPAPVPTTAPTAAPGALKMVGSHWNEHERYMVAHPDREAAHIRLDYGEWYGYIANPENDWDVGFFSLEDGSLEALIKAGIAEDLSGNEVIAAGLKSLYPVVQNALTHEGKVYALPHVVFAGQNPLAAVNADVWQKLGWDINKTPKTFAELCALAEKYMELPLATRRGTRFLVDGDTAAASRRVLLSELINLAYSEAMAKGDPSAIDTPAFREALTQIQSAYKALSKKQASTGANGIIYGLFFDGGQDYMDSYGNLRLGDSAAYTQRLGVAVVNARSTNKAAAIQYMEWLSKNLPAQFLPDLNAVVTAQEIGKIAVEQNLAHYYEKSYMEAGGQSDDAEQIEKLKQMLSSGDYGNYIPDEGAIARYRMEVAPNMTIMSKPFPVTYDIQKDYLSGKLDVDAFIKALQEAAK